MSPSLAQDEIRWSPFFLFHSAKSNCTHFLCTKPARQLSAPIKECEMWLIQSLWRGDWGERWAGHAGYRSPQQSWPCCFPWHPSPTPRWPLSFLYLPSLSFLSPWSSRTVSYSPSPSVNTEFCPNSVSSEKLMCTELSVVDHGLTLCSPGDDQLSNGIAHDVSSALMPKARLATDKCKKAEQNKKHLFCLTGRPQKLTLLPVLSASSH